MDEYGQMFRDVNTAMTLRWSVIHRIALCEARGLVLRPNELYVFEVIEGCAKCAMADEEAKYPGE